jgi:putative membrane protein
MRLTTRKILLNVLATASSCILLSSFFLLTGAIFAQGDNPNSMGKNTMKAGDQKFLRGAAQGGMAEVELGKLAVQKASGSEVKAFGQRMIDDHTKANDTLKALAASKSFTLPADVSAEQKAMRDKLAGLSGKEFDHQFMEQMVEDHKKVVAAFEIESNGGKDGDVKSFASITLPTIKEHLKMAQAMVAKMGI